MNASMHIQVDQVVEVQEADTQAPFNGATGTVVAVVSNVERPYVVVALYGATYQFSDLDLIVLED